MREVTVPKDRPAGELQPSVHSIVRAFEVLEAMADAGGILGLTELSERVGLPKPTVHRLVRTLVMSGYVRQEPASRAYALGPRLGRLADLSGRLLGQWAMPYLHEIVNALGESANLIVLDGDFVVEVCQVPGRHAMRMVSEVGSRALPHCTAAGKAMLAGLPREQAEAIIQRTGMPRFTPATITDHDPYFAELDAVRHQGYATDNEEQESGVRCVAVALPLSSRPAALSISGPLTRMTDELIARAVPLLSDAAANLADEMQPGGTAITA